MASLPLSCKAKPIRSAKTPQSSPCSRTADASFTPLGLLSFSASGTSAAFGDSEYGSNVIIVLLDTKIWPERHSFFDRNLDSVLFGWKGACWWVLGSLVGIAGFVVVVGLIVSRHLGFRLAGDLVLAFVGNFAF